MKEGNNKDAINEIILILTRFFEILMARGVILRAGLYVSIICCLVFINFSVKAQCTVDAFANPISIICGESVQLSASGNSGNLALDNDFNDGTPGSGWSATSSATYTNPCGPGLDGSTHLWMGDATPQPRTLTTVGLDLTLGGQICFDLDFSTQGDAAPCEGPDEPDEGVYLQYSTDGGNTWVTIHYFDPLGGNDPTLTSWNTYCFPIPNGAETGNTLIRWFQDATSGAEYDHWGIDNVQIILNDPNYYYIWLHDQSQLEEPPLVYPTVDSTFTVVYTNGTTDACTANVTVTVTDPIINVNAGPDQMVCAGQCVPLVGEAEVIQYPQQTVTFENNEAQVIDASLGGTAEINVNVQGLHNQTIGVANITQVCIDGLTFFGQNIFPPSAVDIGALEISLVCPDGTSIVLVPDGVTSGTQTSGYTNTCFVPSGGGDISTASNPYSGSYSPNQPFSNLNGCSSNGLWTISISNTSGFGIGLGNFDGWSITFDDPEILAPSNYSWSPTTGLSDPNSLFPDACPTQTTTYTLSVSDQNNCATETDDVTVSIDNNCCPEIDSLDYEDPSCGSNAGYIHIFASGGIPPLSYSIDGNFTTQNNGIFNTVFAGIYYIVVEDANGCQALDTLVLGSGSEPDIDNILTTNPSCGNPNGEIEIIASGGTPPLQYSIDNGTTFQSSNIFTGLTGGNYSVVVEGSDGCSASQNTGLLSTSGPTIDNLTPTDPSCGQQNGGLNISVSGGQLPYQFSVDGGSTYQPGGIFVSLPAGVYDILVEDALGCSVTDQVTLTDLPGPTLDNVDYGDPMCGTNPGYIHITASGGTAPLTYSIDGNFTTQNNGTFNTVFAGTYYIVVQDANGCQALDTVMLNDANAPSIDNINATAPTCGNTDGSIEIIASGGVPPLQYSIDNGATFQASNTFAGLDDGTYSIVVEGSDGCQVSEAMVLPSANEPAVDNITPTSPACGQSDGELNISASGGQAPLQYSIDGGTTFQANGVFTGLAPGSYDIVIEDATGCQTTDQISLSNANGPSITSVTETPPTCGNINGGIDINVSGGQAPLQYSIDNGTTFQATASFANLGGGTYDIVVQDANGCLANDQVIYTDAPGPVIDNIDVIDPTCGNANGEITVTASGGTAPLQYSADNGTTFQSSANITGLAGGNYTIVVEDNTGCQTIGQASLANTSSPTIDNVATTQPTCGASDGEINITASGGAAPLQYSVDGGTTFQTANVFTGLATGPYPVVVEDANGCQATTQTNLNNLNGPSIDNVQANDPACGVDDGMIDITATGGTAPLQYSIDNGTTFQSTGTYIDLPPGTYDIVVIDASNCQSTDQAILASSTAPVIDDITTTEASCGVSDGSITITASSGQAPLQYSINNGVSFQATSGFSNLAPGNYAIIVEDALGCQVTGQASVINLNGPSLDDVAFTNPVCALPNGTITLTASSGTSPLQYSITNGSSYQSTGQFTDLAAGTYDVVVEDDIGCQVFDQVTLENTPIPKIDEVIVLNTTCATSNGELEIVASGGTAPIEFSIDNGATFQSSGIYTGLAAGTYNVMIQDANGCQASDEVTVEPSTLPVADFDYQPKPANVLDPAVIFTNYSSGSVSYEWAFGNIGASTDEDPAFLFPGNEPGTYLVCLVAFNADSCTDTICQEVIVEENFTVYVPNAFTPNGNRRNDSFFPIITGVDEYELYIFDRWGGLMFSSDDENEPWTGKTKDGLEEVAQGVYVWKFIVYDDDGNKTEYAGHITLIR